VSGLLRRANGDGGPPRREKKKTGGSPPILSRKQFVCSLQAITKRRNTKQDTNLPSFTLFTLLYSTTTTLYYSLYEWHGPNPPNPPSGVALFFFAFAKQMKFTPNQTQPPLCDRKPFAWMLFAH
jgi:hypothetical protein